MVNIRFKLTSLILMSLSFFMLSTVVAQETMTTEERLIRLEKAVTNLEEYALLLHYNQIGSVAEFETRIGELERSFSFIVGEVVQLQPAGGTPTANPPTVTSSVAPASQPAPTAPATQAAPATTTTTASQQASQQASQPAPTQQTQVQQPQQQQQQTQTTQSVSVPATSAASTSEEELVYLQVGAYNDAASAAAARVEIEKLGYSVYEGPSGQTIRLFLGPFRLSDVDTMKLWLSQQGIDSFIVR